MNDDKIEPEQSADERFVPKNVLRQFKVYKRWQLIWFAIHYLSGLIAVIAGGLATASGTDTAIKFIQTNAWVWGLTATLFAGIVTLLGPLQQAIRYRRAFNLLNTGIPRYQINEISDAQLINILEDAQNVVDTGEPITSR